MVMRSGVHPDSRLELKDDRVRGLSGCNNFNGGYEVDGDRVAFSQVISTMKACLEGMDTEQLFYAVLEQAAAYKIDGEMLKLFNAGGEELATFRAIYLQ